MPTHQLAQLNVALMRAPLESPLLADFVANLDRINALAENSPGYVWRLQTDEGDATALRPFGDDMLVNLSVWTDIASLQAFVYSGPHLDIMKQRKAWFDRMKAAHTVLWWVPAGHQPDVDEARDRLDRLREHGPAEDAFTFSHPFGPPGSVAATG